MATQRFSVDPSVPVPISIGTSGHEAAEPITVGQVFKKTCAAYPDYTALASLEGDEWVKISYSDYYKLCIRAAKSFVKVGLEPLHGVAVIGFNSPEWSISLIAAMFADGLGSGIYATNSASTCQYILNDCKANVVVVENDMQLQKFLKIRDQLPHLKAIVQYKGPLSGSYPNVYEWSDFLKLGDDLDDQLIEDKIAKQTPSTCAALIYTSGTTGDPKGVMLTHDNITWTAKSIKETFKDAYVPGDTVVSYLPLSHIAGQIVDIYIPLNEGTAVYFAQPDALKGTLGVTLKQVQPHLFLGVPRVWEKFMEAIKAMLPPPGSGPPPSAEMMKAINAKVLAGLGLTRCKIMVTAAAPISLEVLQFFARLGITISEVWGMSELTGPGTTSMKLLPDYYKLGSIGKPYAGYKVKIDQPDPKTGEGEICVGGRGIMMGYLNKLEKTRETIDDEGWLHSGDLGRQDEDGFFYITGRIKELIITSGGENIAPVPIEDRIKKHASFISNVMIVGDKRKFLSCLVTLKCQVDPNTGISHDELSPESLRILSELGSTAKTVSEIINNKDPVVYSAIQKAIDAANEDASSNAQKVQKFAILKSDFSIPGGELGPTLKLKRFYVVSKYSDIIDQMYN